MKVPFYPVKKKHFSITAFTIPIVLFVSLFCLSLSTMAKTVVIGTGSGSVSQTSMSGLSAGDVIAITPGTYSKATFSNLNDVTIINNGGIVKFTGTVSLDVNLVNVTISGTGLAGTTYGFQFSNVSGSAFLFSGTNTRGLRVYNCSFDHVSGYIFDASGYYTKYTGDTTTLKLYRTAIGNLAISNSGLVLQGSWGLPTDFTDVIDSIALFNLTISQTTSNGGQFAAVAYRCDLHDWRVSYAGANPVAGDVGMIVIYGNGSVHHIYNHGDRGYLVRLWNVGLNGVANSYIYNNIDLATNAYGFIDTRIDPTMLAGSSVPYTTGGNCYIYNNTAGNKSDVNYISPMCVIGNFGGYTCEIKNNLAFNNNNGTGSSGILQNNSGGTLSIDTSNNVYYTASQIMNVLSDTVNCYIMPGSPIIDKGSSVPVVTNDIAGIPRPQGSAYDIGAREYSSSSSFVTSNAGNNQTITLPLDSVNLSGSGSSVVNSTISSYQWVETSGPNTATLSSPNTVGTKASGLIVGTYVFSLKVTDANNDASTATVTIVVKSANQPPVVSAGTAQTITLPVNSVTVTGTATDATGTISSYLWTQVSGPATATIANTSAISTNITGLIIAGSYVFQLKATDNNGLSGTGNVTITVNAALNQPPVANAGSNQTITLPTNTVSVNGSASKDPDGVIVSFNWTQISGPSQGTIANAASVSTTITNLVQGIYIYKLTVTDNGGATGSDTMTITVNAAVNQPPVANAGTSKTITLPVNSTSLDGTKSSDPDGTIVSYSWSELSGPSTATISSASTATPTVSALVAGKYVFVLTVTDNSGATSTAQVNITVSSATNTNPTANAGANQTITLPVNSVSVDGSASVASSGSSIISFGWAEISGPSQGTIANPNNVSTVISNLAQGIYVFQLTVTDNNGNTGVDSITVAVNTAMNQPPVANAGTSKTITLPVNSTSLDGTKSSDPDGTIASYSWSELSGPSTATINGASTASPVVSVLVAGQYTFQLTVTDNNGASSSSQVKITVLAAANQLPIADAGTNQTITLPTSVVNLDGSKSYDPDGTIASYSWSKASGTGALTITNSNTAKPTVSGLQAGSYVFKLTVADNNGATASAQVTITVNAAPVTNQPPVANAGKDTTIAIPANSATLNGSASTAPSGNIVTYDWAQVSGPSTSVISSFNTAVTPVNTLVAGVYVYTLTVTDNLGGTSTDTVQVTVVDNTRLGSTQSLLLYPNPTFNTVNLQITSNATGQMHVTIYDMRGKISMVKEYDKPSDYFSSPINVSSLYGGTYLLQATINKKTVIIGKFVKQ
jgi:hypothetical protein